MQKKIKNYQQKIIFAKLEILKKNIRRWIDRKFISINFFNNIFYLNESYDL